MSAKTKTVALLYFTKGIKPGPIRECVRPDIAEEFTVVYEDKKRRKIEFTGHLDSVVNALKKAGYRVKVNR